MTFDSLSKKPLFIFGTAIASSFFILIFFVFWFLAQLRPVSTQNSSVSRFVIPKGRAIQLIGQDLVQEGLIRNSFVFRVIVWQKKLQGKIQAGSFELSPSMTVVEIAQQLAQGTDDAWVQLLEGWRSEEIAEAFADFTDIDQELLLTEFQQKEGYLFPDTYLFPEGVANELVLKTLQMTFEQKISQLLPEIDRQGKTVEEIVILASLIQREAKTLEQMKMVSGILQNRLEIGQALQVDATLQYLAGQNKSTGKWWISPSPALKQLSSPFNTYLNPGLPPSPICNPGFDALTAAVYPTESDNLYYLHDDSGRMYYAPTYEQHLQNIEKYLK